MKNRVGVKKQVFVETLLFNYVLLRAIEGKHIWENFRASEYFSPSHLFLNSGLHSLKIG